MNAIYAFAGYALGIVSIFVVVLIYAAGYWVGFEKGWDDAKDFYERFK